MLKFGAYLNFLIAAMHFVGLLWAEKLFALTGVTGAMARLAAIHTSLPYVLTIFAGIFFLFGCYGLSAAGIIKPFPYLGPAIFTIAGLYLLRAMVGEFTFSYAAQPTHEVLYAIVFGAIGLLFLLGGYIKFNSTKCDVR